MKTVSIVSAGLRSPSSTKLLGERIKSELQTQEPRLKVEHVELRELANDIVKALGAGFPGKELEETMQRVRTSDMLVALTPTLSGSYSGLFKIFFDLFEKGAFDEIPVLLGATGGSARHSLMIEHSLRPLMSYLGMISAPTGVYAATEDFANPALHLRIQKAVRELLQLSELPRQLQGGHFEIEDFEMILKRNLK